MHKQLENHDHDLTKLCAESGSRPSLNTASGWDEWMLFTILLLYHVVDLDHHGCLYSAQPGDKAKPPQSLSFHRGTLSLSHAHRNRQPPPP